MREHGGITDGGVQKASTLQCCHCNAHRLRRNMIGFCRKCMGPTCSTAKCNVCVPFEYLLDVQEGTKQDASIRRD